MENRNCNKTERDVLAKGINPEGYSVESDLAVLNENLRNFQKRRVISLGLRRSPAKSADRMSASVEWNRLRSSQDGIIESGRDHRVRTGSSSQDENCSRKASSFTAVIGISSVSMLRLELMNTGPSQSSRPGVGNRPWLPFTGLASSPITSM